MYYLMRLIALLLCISHTYKMDANEVQYTDVVHKLPEQDRPRAQNVREKMIAQQKQFSQGLVHNNPREEKSPNSMAVIKTLRQRQNVDENTFMAIVDGIKGCRSLLRSQAGSAHTRVTMERDFTTNGTQGSLHCPFSEPKKTHSGIDTPAGKDDPQIPIEDAGGHEEACGHEDLDPIHAEQHERLSSQTSRSSTGQCSVSRCPIRFLDQHSPEEIAEYVERHKHEIPRSHAICVKRYQDAQNMRQLDAKYGGLPSMIRGLGVKHQAFLPNRQVNGGGEDDGQKSNSASTKRVENWADDVEPGPQQHEDDNRQSHFDRPLREVRVGESPSRPWGIPVPITHHPTVPFSGSVSVPKSTGQFNSSDHPTGQTSVELNHEAPSKPAGRCPFGHGAPKPPVDAVKPDSPGNKADHDDDDDEAVDADAPKAEDPTAVKSDTTSPAHVTFNGPVFFGYDAEQTARLMQQLGQLGQP